MVGTLICAVIAVVFLGIALWVFRSVRARRTWPVTRGTITDTAIRQNVSVSDDEESVTFVPVVEYRYQVGTAAYASSGIGFGEVGYGAIGSAEKVLAQYPIGSAVDVHYNPAKPGETFLKPGGGVIAWIMLGVGATTAAVAVVLGYYGI
jgi:hypothetical protein